MQYQVVNSRDLYPERIETKNGVKILDTYRNLEWLLRQFKIEIKYNLMTRMREIIIPNHYIFKDDIENSALNKIRYLARINYMPTNDLDMHLDDLAGENPYHPIVECIKSKPWDGTNRLDDFIKTITATDPNLAYKLIYTWMVAACAAAHSEDGFINHGVLVLQGKQSLGKTSWVRALNPITAHAIKEGALLDPSNKDSVLMFARHWIIELGEIDATFNSKDVAQLKSFITLQADDVRMPYAHRAVRLPRRSAYIATVNNQNFLADDTGNRRWWTIEVEAINYDHGMDMQQVWAQVYTYWQNGAKSYLVHDIQEAVNRANTHHEKVDPFTEILLTKYDWDNPGRNWKTLTQILRDIGYEKPSPVDCRRMGTAIRKIT